MKTVFKLTLGLAFTIVCVGCSLQINGDDTIKSYPMDVPMMDYVLPDGTDWQGLKRDTVYLFNSKDDILPYVSKADIPEIDFDKYSLMVVSGVNNSGIKSISSQFQQTEKDMYRLNITIESTAASVVEEWNVAKLVPMLAGNTTIEYLLNGFLKTSAEDSYPHRVDIVGYWKLTETSRIYNYDNENTVTVDYSSNNITYQFRADNKLIIRGYVPDDLSEVEYSYTYKKPDVGILSLPGPNLQIGNEDPVFCIAHKNENKMTIGGEKQIDGTRIRWSKIFVKID